MNQRIHFAVLMLKPSFNFLGPTMKSQIYSKKEALLKIREVPRHSKDQTTRSKMDWQSTIQFAQMCIKVI